MSDNVSRGGRFTGACYFCNDSIEERYMAEHVQHCGAVLEECPEKCGSYVPRRNSRLHREHCPRRLRAISAPGTGRISSVEKNDATLRDGGHAALKLVRSSLAESEAERSTLRRNLSIAFRRLDNEDKSLKALSDVTCQEYQEMSRRSSAVEAGMKSLEDAHRETEKRVFHSLGVLSSRLNIMENRFANETQTSVAMTSQHETELRELTRFVVKESAIVRDLWDSQTKRLNDLKLELEIRCKITRELENKQDTMAEKIDAVAKEIHEHADELRKQRESLKTLKNKTTEMTKLLEDLVDENVFEPRRNDEATSDTLGTGAMTSGRLLWRIDRYKEKMTDAKENDTVFYSSIFHSKDYGYALKMELFMNGRRQWRGRHVIGCLRVVPGPWDPLLDWPCVLRATVTLRDQDNPANDIRKIVKTKSHGFDDNCESYEKDSGFDMFIPHTTLTRYNGFTKNDVVFLDVQISDLRGSLSTSSIVA